MLFSHRIVKSWQILVITLVMGTMIFVQLPFDTRIMKEFQNTGHTIASGILAGVVLTLIKNIDLNKKLTIKLHYIVAIVIAMLCGIFVEIFQLVIGRDAEVKDVVRNMIGVISIIGVYASFDKNLIEILGKKKYSARRITILIISIFLLLSGMVPLYNLSIAYFQRNKAFPVLLDFQSGWSRYFYSLNKTLLVDLRLEDIIQNSKNIYKKRVVFLPGEYSGINYQEPVSDWSEWSYITFYIYIKNEPQMFIGLRINDKNHNNFYEDRYNKKIILNKGANIVRISLLDIKNSPKNRKMDMTSIQSMILFSMHRDQKEIIMSNIILE